MMKHTFFILFAAAMLVAGCNHSDNNPDKNNSGNVPSGKKDKTDDGSNTLSDIDGNTYKTVKIGEQVWMAENLKVTKDRDGKEIALGSDTSTSTPHRYCPDNLQYNVEEYGYLYNWEAAMRVCPKGWHLPTDAEWTQLTDYVSSQSQYVCGDDKNSIAKALASTDGWECHDGSCTVGNNLDDNNATGFGVLGAGYYYWCMYLAIWRGAWFWSATESDISNAWCRSISSRSNDVKGDSLYKVGGFSVRCVRD